MTVPVFVAQSQSYRVRRFVVYVPQPNLRYVGAIAHARYETLPEAQAAVAVLMAANTYTLDAAGWWRTAV